MAVLIDREPETLVMQNGTITIVIDYPAEEVRLYSEPDPSPADWRQAQEVMAECSGGMTDCYDDHGTDVFAAQLLSG